MRTALICYQHEAGKHSLECGVRCVAAGSDEGSTLRCSGYSRAQLARRVLAGFRKSTLCSGGTIFTLNCPRAESLHNGNLQTEEFFFSFSFFFPGCPHQCG